MIEKNDLDQQVYCKCFLAIVILKNRRVCPEEGNLYLYS